MPNDLWQTTLSGDELRQAQRGIDRAMADTIRHRPYSPEWSGDGKAAPLTEDQILATVFDGAYSTERARDLKARIKALPDAARAGLIGRLGRLSDREIRDEIISAEGGLSPEERDRWRRV